MFNPAQLEHFGKMNFLKAGIVHANRVTTVSARYAEEIQTSEYGYGLHEVIAGHAHVARHHQWHRLSGVGCQQRPHLPPITVAMT